VYQALVSFSIIKNNLFRIFDKTSPVASTERGTMDYTCEKLGVQLGMQQMDTQENKR
jgi:hypothetical protein